MSAGQGIACRCESVTAGDFSLRPRHPRYISRIVRMVHHNPEQPAGTKEITEGLARLVARDRDHECDGYGPDNVCVRISSFAELPTRVGHFRIVAFWNNRDAKEHVAMIHGDVIG